MSKNKKMIRNFILFILLIILTFYFVLRDQNIYEMFNILKSVKKEFILIGLLCMLGYLGLEAINLGRTLKALNEKSNFLSNFKYALIGFFFSSITPAASGGQPMQIYYMYKDGIAVSNSTLALLLNLTSMQICTIGIALVSLIFNHQYMNKLLIIFFIVGIALNSSALILLLIGVFSKRLSKWLIDFAIKVLKLFRVKNIESKKEKFEAELAKYQEGAKYVKHNRLLMLKILGTTLIQFLTYYSVTYWTYRALGFSQYNILRLTSLQAVLYATVSGIPSPGAVGVTEGAFTEIFRNIYPENIMSSAVLLNRGINFYLLVLMSGIVTIISHMSSEKDKTNEIEEKISEER